MNQSSQEPPALDTSTPYALALRTGTESSRTKHLFHTLALLLTLALLYTLSTFFAPAPCRPGIDENAYLLAGRNFAETLTAGYEPASDYEYVGAMWVRSVTTQPSIPLLGKHLPTIQEGTYYPKYPAGLPALNGLFLTLLGGTNSLAAAERTLFLAAASTTLAFLGLFYLTRAALGNSFLAICAALLLIFNPTTLAFSQTAGSHAPTLATVIWGFFFLLRALQTGGQLRYSIPAGFLLGFAVTLRYSEALLLFPLYPLPQILSDTGIPEHQPLLFKLIKLLRVLPIGPLGIAAAYLFFSHPTSDIRHPTFTQRLVRAATPIFAWSLPVALLLLYNLLTLGTLTGYDTTAESTGFTTATFLRKWDFTLSQLNTFGLLLTLPLGLAGLGLLFRTNRLLALLLTTWFLPGALLYNAYYWGQEAPGPDFLRFYLTLYPPLIIAALSLLSSPHTSNLLPQTSPRKQVALPLTAGLLTATVTAISLNNTLPLMELQHRGNLNLATSIRELHVAISASERQTPNAQRPRPVIFADEGVFPQLLMLGQFSIPADWNTLDAYNPAVGGGFGPFGMLQANAKNGPVLLQKARLDHAIAFKKSKSDADMIKDFTALIHTAAAEHRPVYALLTKPQFQYFNSRFLTPQTGIQATPLTRWTEPCQAPPPEKRGPLAPPFFFVEAVIRWKPQSLTLYQLTPTSTSTPTPTTQPNLASTTR